MEPLNRVGFVAGPALLQLPRTASVDRGEVPWTTVKRKQRRWTKAENRLAWVVTAAAVGWLVYVFLSTSHMLLR